MSEHVIEVLQVVTVKIDDSKFTAEFMENFRHNFYDYETVEEHAEHLAQLAARGLIETPCFIEGYGPSQDRGIEIEVGVR